MTECWFHLTGECNGTIQRAHLIPKQRLRPFVPADAIWDWRVWVPACERHHHQFDHGFIELSLDDYPATLVEYAIEHHFAWYGQVYKWRHEREEQHGQQHQQSRDRWEPDEGP